MAKRNRKGKIFFLILLVLILTPNSLSESNTKEDWLELNWSYIADSDIVSLTHGDINSDSFQEILFSTAKKLYIFTKQGKIKIFNLTSKKGKPYIIEIGNLFKEENDDNLTQNEIFLGFGWIERIPVERKYLNATPGGEIITNEEILYEKSLDKGEIEILEFNSKGNIEKKNEVKVEIDGWPRAISIDDIDYDGEKELIVVTGGENTFYYEIFSPKPISNTSSSENLSYGEGLSKETYEEKSLRSSILIFSKNLTLILNKSYDENIFWDGDVGNLYNDKDMEIIAGGTDKNLYSFLTPNLTIDWQYTAPGEIKKIFLGDLQNDGIIEILIYFSSNTFSGVEGITRDGNKFLEFRIPLGERLRAINLGKLDPDDEKEIFLSTTRNLYIYDLDGKIKFKYEFPEASHLTVSDLDKDGYGEIILSKENKIYCYKFSKKVLKKRDADMLCGKAKETSISNSTLAKNYAIKAIEIYTEINDTEGISECSSLLSELNIKIKEKKKVEADTYYAKAIGLFSFEDYKKAKEYLEKAIKIYKEINYTEGIKNSEDLLSKINMEIQTTTTIIQTSKQTTTTIPSQTTTTLTIQNHNKEKNFLGKASIILLILTFLLLIFFMIRWRKQQKKEEKELEEEFKT